MADNSFNNTVESLFKGMDSFITTKTVVGDAIQIGDTVLVIQNGVTKLVNIKNQDGMTKILDMVPDFINKFTSGKDTDDIIDDVVSDDTDNE